MSWPTPLCIRMYSYVFACIRMYICMYRDVSKGSMYRRTDRRVHVSVRRYTDRCTCIAGPIHDRYMGIFFMYPSFLRVFGRPLRYAPNTRHARIHAKHSKIHQNTFGGIRALDLGGIAPKPRQSRDSQRLTKQRGLQLYHLLLYIPWAERRTQSG